MQLREKDGTTMNLEKKDMEVSNSKNSFKQAPGTETRNLLVSFKNYWLLQNSSEISSRII